MNRNELEAAAEGRLFDAMLDEVVQERMAARGTLQRGRSRWLAAALMLLGLGVVVGVVVTSRSGAAVAVAPQEPVQEPLPPVVKVRGLAELLQADRATVHLACAVEGPDFGPLREFTALRALLVAQDHDLPFRTLEQSAWSLAPLVACAKLESLSIGPLARFTEVELAPIVGLPRLRSLELIGTEKVVDAAFVAVLAKLSLRSLVLHSVHIVPTGLQALGELPLLERLELRDCTGLETCDLTHLYRLRQLRALGVRGFGLPRQVVAGGSGTAVSIQLPEMRDGKFVVRLTAEWMHGLAKALPNLHELDLTESMIDDEVLLAMPRNVVRLGIRGALGYGELGVAAAMDLPGLRVLACGDPAPSILKHNEEVPTAIWWPTLYLKKLQRIEFTGFPTAEFTDALSQQVELRELRLEHASRGSFPIGGPGLGAGVMIEDPLPDFGFLADMPKLEKIELLRPSQALEAAIRQALPEVLANRVRIEILPP